MTDKVPVRVVFDASNVATGLAEMQSGEAVGAAHGGTGLTAIGSAGQILKVNAAGSALEFSPEGDVSITNLVAPTNSDLTFTTSGTGNIVLDAITVRGTTISSADSSIININEGVVVDGTLNTSGQATLSGLAYPTSDGTIGQFLKTDGSGTLSFADLSLGDLSIVGSTITTPSNADFILDPSGTGKVNINGAYTLPSADGNADQFLKTDGSGVVSFADLSLGDLTIIGSTISVPSNADFTLDPSGTGAIKLNANTDITGNLTVTGTLDLGDSNFTNVGSLQLDSIAGDGDTNTSITFSGSDVITVATGGSTAATFNADQSVSLSGALTVTGVTTLTGGVSTNSVTGDVIPGKIAGTNFTESLLVGSTPDGTLSSAERNVGVGFFSMQKITTGDDNTALGWQSLRYNRTGVTNTAIGNNSMGNTGNAPENNTATGHQALKDVQGNHNVALGSRSGRNITTGSGNLILGDVEADSATADRQLKISGYDGTDTTTWIEGDNTGKVSFPGGDGAGLSILSSTISTAASNADITLTPHGTGSINVTVNSVSGEVIPGKIEGTNFTNSLLIGHSTSGTLSSAERNTGVGIAALDALTSGDGNTALGSTALSSTTSGLSNTAIGDGAGTDSTGNENVFVGAASGFAAVGGGRNTIIGRSAGFGVTSGNNNILVGHDAGKNITSGKGNIVIGSEINVGSATGDHQLVIGNTDDSTSVTWISGDSSGNLTFAADVIVGDDLELNTDTSVIKLGADGEIAITHVHNTGILITDSGGSPTVQLHDANESVSSDGTNLIFTSGGTAFKMPIADGNAGDVLKTDGSGTMSFASAAATASDDTRVTVKTNKSASTTARTIDFFQASGADMVWYFMACNDLTNDHSSANVFTVCHNDADAFIGSPRGGASGTANSMVTTTADVSSNQVRVKIAGPSDDSKISLYKIPISRANTENETAGVTITTSNTDVDSASESIDTFAHASFRAAKYTILVDDNAKTETGVTEALVVHDGTNAFIIQYGTVNTGNNDMITLSAAISGSNVVVSAAGLTPNLSLKTHKTLLSDSMTAVSNANQKIIGATTVSSTATAFDSIDLDDNNAAVYYIVGKNATEGVFSVQEVYLTGAPGEAGVAQGPFVSSKETTQLEFTSAYLTTTDNSVGLSISSTSGGSTVVNAYRISCLAE